MVAFTVLQLSFCLAATNKLDSEAVQVSVCVPVRVC